MKKTMNKVAALGLVMASVVALAAPAQAEVKLPNGLSFGSQIFGDYTSQSDNKAVPTNFDASNGFHIGRAYFYATDKIDDNISARVTIDALNNNNAAPTIFIKHAYVDYKLNDAATVEAGLGGTPWVSFVEKLWGYRYIADSNNFVAGKVLSDRTGALSSSDTGVSVSGAVSGFNYMIGAYNGEGYNRAANGGGLKIGGRLGYDFDGGLGIAAYYDTETKRGGVVGSDPTRTAAVVYFKQPAYTIAAEYLMASDYAGTVAPIAPGVSKFADGNAYSVFGNVLVTDAIRLFARYDAVTPVTRVGVLNANITDTVLTAGATYILGKGQEIGINYSTANDGKAVSTTTNTLAVNLLTGF
jgi:hypothetical protein